MKWFTQIFVATSFIIAASLHADTATQPVVPEHQVAAEPAPELKASNTTTNTTTTNLKPTKKQLKKKRTAPIKKIAKKAPAQRTAKRKQRSKAPATQVHSAPPAGKHEAPAPHNNDEEPQASPIASKSTTEEQAATTPLPSTPSEKATEDNTKNSKAGQQLKKSKINSKSTARKRAAQPEKKKAAISSTKSKPVPKSLPPVQEERSTQKSLPKKQAAKKNEPDVVAEKPQEKSRASDDEDDDDACDETCTHDDDDEEDDDSDDSEQPDNASNKQIMIRVLLKEYDAEPKTTFSIQSDKGFYLSTPANSKKQIRYKHEIVHLVAMHHNLFMRSQDGSYKRLRSNELGIKPVNGKLKIDNLSYEGTLHIRFDEELKKIQHINKINLDDYLYSVLRFESLSYWPAEVHRVQAVASRTYVVYQILQSRKQNKTSHYDIKNNNFHQVYNGYHDCHHLRQAVMDTHNQILMYKGNVALTMFDICCGGIIGAAMKKKDSDKPYLFRKTRCSYCKDKAPFSWTNAFNKGTLLQRLLANPRTAPKAKKLGSITNIGIKEKDQAGIAHRISIHGSKQNIILTCNEFKAALQEKIKSNAYSIKKVDNDVIIHGYGFGHNIGLCQIGARELVARGWEFEEILAFYFPKTKLMRIKIL